ncbi:MAG: rRNA maturation RNase YbeY [Clostridia bacterium]|nr:rRNA maturation RNase YbeY [Clostridia bacterium]
MAKLKIVSEEKINAKKIAKAVYKTLNQRAKLKAELVFMGEEEMQKLNAETRGIDKVTDVLSFPTLDSVRGKILEVKDYPYETEKGRLMIGSIVMCNQKIKEQAEEFGHTEEREKTYLLVHGLMHLFGLRPHDRRR